MEEGHFWTGDLNGELLEKPPWKREGPACYVLNAPDPAAGIIPALDQV